MQGKGLHPIMKNIKRAKIKEFVSKILSQGGDGAAVDAV